MTIMPTGGGNRPSGEGAPRASNRMRRFFSRITDCLFTPLHYGRQLLGRVSISANVSREEVEFLLDQWVEEGLPQERRGREIAKNAIHSFLHNSNENSLRLQELKLTSFPAILNCVDFRDRLVNLDLSGNRLKSPPDVQNLRVLSYLDLSHNLLGKPPNTQNLENLTRLYLNNNELFESPDTRNLRNLKYFNISDNQLVKPPSVRDLTELVSLNISNNWINSPPDTEKLTSLKELNLSFNYLRDSPNLSNLSNLLYLNLSSNWLTNLADIQGLTALEGLYLANNKLTTLPDMSTLTSLFYVDLSANNLSTFPDIKKLRNLTFIDLSYNRNLRQLPDYLLELPPSLTITINHCDFTAEEKEFLSLNCKGSFYEGPMIIVKKEIDTTDADSAR